VERERERGGGGGKEEMEEKREGEEYQVFSDLLHWSFLS
jgi:hypothetical protein